MPIRLLLSTEAGLLPRELTTCSCGSRASTASWSAPTGEGRYEQSSTEPVTADAAAHRLDGALRLAGRADGRKRHRADDALGLPDFGGSAASLVRGAPFRHSRGALLRHRAWCLALR